ncbi:MAG: hypothetical protein GY810_12805 [Aureispira sp.]|nr:hypothetical protein [Aureispira sp.]
MKDHKKEIAEELNEISPFLAKLKKEKKPQSGLPSNYFNNFGDRLLSRIKEEEALTPKTTANAKKDNSFWAKISWLFRPQYAIGLATMLILVVVGINMLNQTPATVVNDNPEQLLAQLSADDLNIYIDENLDEFSTEDIIETMDEQTIEQLPSTEKAFKEAKATIEKTEPIKTPSPVVEKENTIEIDDLTEEDILEILDEEEFGDEDDII